ncbi:MAG: prepilin-type N-terminal cleavage/methylation domain-containing protein [Candidatus Omnitrophota bacterium]|nr:prepilin-type N-terminal cleavage/methylation domain-containing protein [Candidatus Omnitrophota bacterium]
MIRRSGYNRGFTLQEILVVLIIVGILAALALPNYTKMKDDALNKVAKSTLALVRAGEQIYRMEYGTFWADAPTSGLNTNLKLTIPTGADSKWEYKAVAGSSDIKSSFYGKARRQDDTTKVWCINQSSEEAYPAGTAGCSW